VGLSDLSFGQRVNLYAGKAQALVEPRDVLLIARNAVKRLGQHQIQFPTLCILHQSLDAHAHETCPGDRVIGVALHDSPTFTRRAIFTEP
jgi:hypothetical protein